MARSVELISEKAIAPPVGALAVRSDVVVVLERHVVLVLVVLTLLGFGLRVSGLGSVGFAEDEINKLEAVRAYERGDITPNAEHPMAMKALIFVSMQAAQIWNGTSAGATRPLADETAVRLPNALFGALTVFPLFLLAAALFNRRTALLAAAFWAFGINAITYNRIAKEDTLLVFFMLLAFYFYIRAKQTSGFAVREKRRNYILSAVAFGWMMASKYFPHYFGLNMLYHHIAHVRGERAPGEPRGNTPKIFYLVLLVAFLVANPAILVPETWHYLSAYSSEGLLTHRGYLMGESLYDNLMSQTPFGGTPFYFYLLFLATKVPLPVLAALAVGLCEIFRRRREPGAAFLLLMFVLWIVPYSLVGAKWLRYTLSLMPFAYMIAALGVTALVGLTLRLCREHSESASVVRAVAVAGSLLVFVVLPGWASYAARPHYALYTNALAPQAAGYYFPHDEFYDDGLREAIVFISTRAPSQAVIAHETPGVVRYYLGRFGRTDLRSRIISDPHYNPLEAAPAETSFVILQRGRTYFENREEMRGVRAGERFVKVYEGLVGGVTAVEVYASREWAGSGHANGRANRGTPMR